MLNVIMLSVGILSVVMLNVVILSVVAPIIFEVATDITISYRLYRRYEPMSSLFIPMSMTNAYKTHGRSKSHFKLIFLRTTMAITAVLSQYYKTFFPL
jgi:hypothetical protein